MFAGILAFLAPAIGFLKKVPWQVYASIGLVGLVGLGACVHSHKVKAFGNARYEAGKKEVLDKLDKAHLEAISLKHQLETVQAKITEMKRNERETALRDNATFASSVLMRGPGASSCRQSNHPSVPASPGGHERATAEANAAGPSVPTDDRAAVPWPWLVNRAHQFDDCLVTNKTWNDWYEAQSKAWPVQ